ncbi:unnamed protein product, partial [Polarella glacialis]
FPQTMEEASAFFLEAGDEGAEAQPKAALRPDAVVVLKSSDEACLLRAQASETKPFVERDFQMAVEKWKKEGDGALTEFFSTRLGAAVADASADLAADRILAEHEAQQAAAAEAAAAAGEE